MKKVKQFSLMIGLLAVGSCVSNSMPEEDKNPVDIQLESFLECVRTGARPKADLNVGLEDSINVMLANLAMDEGRRVYMNEIDKMGTGAPAAPAKKA